jgi:hypothetical protein
LELYEVGREVEVGHDRILESRPRLDGARGSARPRTLSQGGQGLGSRNALHPHESGDGRHSISATGSPPPAWGSRRSGANDPLRRSHGSTPHAQGARPMTCISRVNPTCVGSAQPP